MAERGWLDRAFGGVRGQVTLAALCVTAVTLTCLGIGASIMLSRQVRADVETSMTEVLDEVEVRLRAGEAISSFTHSSGVEVFVDRSFVSDDDSLGMSRTVELDGGRTAIVNARAPVASLTQTLAALRLTLWILMPLAAGLTALVANLAVRRALRPVSDITATARQITTAGSSERVPIPATADEVAVLAETINDMLSSLERHELDRRRFVSDASHELRSPLMVLINEAELAAEHHETADVAAFAAAVHA